MKLPRDLDADELIRQLQQFGYTPTRQTGSHIRLTRVSKEGEQHVTIPNHSPLRIGTLNNILNDIANQIKMSKEELLRRIR